jgi:hypothetical protein
MSLALAFVWVATGAAAMGVSIALARPDRPGTARVVVPFVVSLGILILACAALLVHVTAWSATIDSAQPVETQCGSAWGALDSPQNVVTDTGPVYSQAYGACRAAGWHRVASVGAAEVGIAVIIGASAVWRRRRTGAPGREAARTAA